MSGIFWPRTEYSPIKWNIYRVNSKLNGLGQTKAEAISQIPRYLWNPRRDPLPGLHQGQSALLTTRAATAFRQ